ncbi:alpha/beta hydrolase [Chryseolinea sp. H1M3-3]|uniref:alpha/beta hydrolase n=1 Tax=Chryseolinea sp. H1M3-3 TaxID=3034144 RepID=UPI0023EB25FD|nr:alpha/beta hydrolase [Chryseolinea sp. H1M3-3]
MQPLITLLAVITVLASLRIFFRIRQPSTPAWWAVKVFVTAPSPILLFAALVCFLYGVSFSSPMISILSGISVLTLFIHIIKVTRSPDVVTGFAQAFGIRWETRIHGGRRASFLMSRMGFGLPVVVDPLLKKDIPFYTIPGTTRQLLCDVWEPSHTVGRSGLAFVYLHGSAWYLLDKDYGTRTFFRHLAAQGHVIMDVAYRLFPETNMMGMVHDAKHAIAWMKANASAYGVNPARIVIGGGSAGGHIALLAAYTHRNKEFTPRDLEEIDTSVNSVIAMYGPPDLKALYYHTGQHLLSRKPVRRKKNKEGPGTIPKWVQKILGDPHRLGMDKDFPEIGTLAAMFGGHPEELPEPYFRFSPVTHVHAGCPPTLFIQGEHDLITPVQACLRFVTLLKQAGVPTVMHLLPQIDHAFDLIWPKVSPSAHNAYYDVERFLGLMCEIELTPATNPEKIASNRLQRIA